MFHLESKIPLKISPSNIYIYIFTPRRDTSFQNDLNEEFEKKKKKRKLFILAKRKNFLFEKLQSRNILRARNVRISAKITSYKNRIRGEEEANYAYKYPTTRIDGIRMSDGQWSKTGGQFLRGKKKKKEKRRKKTLAIRLVSGSAPSFARGFSRHLRFDMSYPGR